MTPEQLDAHLDKILKASGSSLKNYSTQKTKDDMRMALRRAIVAEAGPIRKALAALVGVEGGPALDTMEASIRAAEAPQADKAVILDAIHTLRETDAWPH